MNPKMKERLEFIDKTLNVKKLLREMRKYFDLGYDSKHIISKFVRLWILVTTCTSGQDD